MAGGIYFLPAIYEWVPRVVQEELFEYFDSVVSVSGAVEREELLPVLDQSLLPF